MLKRHLIVIPLNKITTQKEFSEYYFEKTYNEDNQKGSIIFKNKIIVLEDIDCMSDIVKQRKIQGENDGLGNADDIINNNNSECFNNNFEYFNNNSEYFNNQDYNYSSFTQYITSCFHRKSRINSLVIMIFKGIF